MDTLNDYRKDPHWSYSSLNTYLNVCSLRYAFQYVYRCEQERTSACLPMGRAFHGALSEYAIATMKGKYPDVKEIQESFAELLKIECSATDNLKLKEGESIDTLIEQGQNMLNTAIASWNKNETVLDVAKPFRVSVRGVSRPLIGEMDCLIKDKYGVPVIIDWKTSSTKWSPGKVHKDLQATCFSYAYSIQERKLPLFRFDVITKNKKPVFESLYTKRTIYDFDRLSRILSVVEKAVDSELFLPSGVGYMCSECPFASACKKWHCQSTSRSVCMHS